MAELTNQQIQELLAQYLDLQRRAQNFFQTWGIQTIRVGDSNQVSRNHVLIDGTYLYQLLTDPDKCRELISKLNNKAFW